MSHTVLSDLLGFLVLLFCPCKLQLLWTGKTNWPTADREERKRVKNDHRSEFLV